MSDKGGFGFDPDDFDRVIREGTEGLRDAFERIGRFVGTPGVKTGWSAIFEDLSRRSRPEPETTGESRPGCAQRDGKPPRVRKRRATVVCERSSTSGFPPGQGGPPPLA